MDTEITVTTSGLALSGPLLAGERVAVFVSGVSFSDGAKPTLVLLSRFPDALLASVELTEGNDGAWSGVLDTATRQVGAFFATARADERRDAVLELVDANGETRESVARLLVPFCNSALCPSPMHAQPAASVYVPGPQGPQGPEGPEGPEGPQGDPQTPSDTTPLTDGTGAAGSATTYARGDHRHPTDTSRVARTGDTGLTGDFKTTGNIGAANIMARSDVTIGDPSSANGYVDIAHEGVLVASDGTDPTAIAIPGGKQAANPDNTLPVLATTNQIPAAQVNSDWNAASGVAQILNKPTIPSTPAGVGITTEVWTFTLSDNSTVSKTVCTVAAT